MRGAILILAAAAVRAQDYYCAFTSSPGQWCEGEPNTPAFRNRNSDQVQSLSECWESCKLEYPGDLVAVNYWPLKEPGPDNNVCFCQTECTEITTAYTSQAHPSYLAIMQDALPPSSGLTCDQRTVTNKCCDAVDVVSMLILAFLGLSALLCVVGCCWARTQGHWKGRSWAEEARAANGGAPVPMGVVDVEIGEAPATTTVRTEGMNTTLLPGGGGGAINEAVPMGLPAWEPMSTTGYPTATAMPSWVKTDDSGVPIGLPVGMEVAAPIGVGKPLDAPPAFHASPGLVPEGISVGLPVESNIPEHGDGCWGGLLGSPHCKTLLLTIALLALIVPLPICNATFLAGPVGCGGTFFTMRLDGDEGEQTALRILPVLIVVYLFECGVSKTMRYLTHVREGAELVAHVESVRRSRPNITFHIQCYHFETRYWTEEVEKEDAEGNKYKETVEKSREERVNTHHASHGYAYSWVRDVSIQGEAHKGWPGRSLLCQIAFTKAYVFGDEYTRSHFEWMKSAFISANNLDTHYDFWIKFDLPGFESAMLMEMFPGARPKALNAGAFFLASLFLLSYPYRVWFSSIAKKRHYDYVKEIVVARPAAPSRVPTIVTNIINMVVQR